MEKNFEIEDRLCVKVVKRVINESENIFVKCMNCDRIYKRRETYPCETCGACNSEGVKLKEVIKK